jgi:hypothetical protein
MVIIVCSLVALAVAFSATKYHGVPGPWMSRVSVAALAVLGLGLVLWMLGFGVATSCTNDALCTLERCPDRCSRPEQILVVTGVVLLVLSVVFVLGTWISRRVYLSVAVALTVVAGAAMYVLAA